MIFENLPPATAFITANQRLAAYLRTQYDQAQQTAGRTVWESLDCLSLDSWITRTYQMLPDAVLLLNPAQELTLWEQIIAASVADVPELALLSPRALAKTAIEAWHTLHRWETPLPALVNTATSEVQAFVRWAAAFDQYCHDHHCVDNTVAMARLIAALPTAQLSLPKQLFIAGFEEMPPQVQHLFAVLATRCKLQVHQPTPTDSKLQRIGLPDAEQELSVLARWAYRTWEQNPMLRIGCVVPDLAAQRDKVERIFRQVFPTQGAGKNAFNIAGGTSLQRFPLIQAAFDILKLAASELDAALVSRWLRSPFWGGAEQELTARALLDVRLRDTREPRFRWRTLLSLAEKQEDCELLLQHSQAWLEIFNTTPPWQSAQSWAQHFAQQLQIMGWPGERTLNSAEYQQLQRWQALLTEFGQLDRVLHQPLSAAQAWQALSNLAQDTLFQPQTADAPVQVLGLLEAVGLNFDYLWVCGMTQEEWPRSPAPNPFIPLALQRKHQMPHASAERELIYSQTLMAHFSQCAPQVIFSYALQKEDRVQLPSALLSHIKEISLDELFFFEEEILLPLWEKVPAGREGRVVYYSDEYGPPLQPTEPLHGGASLFKHQAACPFRAFAKIRLGAQALPGSESAITLSERGMYLHDILEQVWKTLKDHTTLCRHTESALTMLVQQAVDDVLARYAARRPVALKAQYMALERQRLVALMMEWLAVEKQRPPFRVIATEAKREITFAGLALTLRLDREDEVADGVHMVVDYKTGVCHPTQWFGERPDDPQLPLYGVTGEPPAQGLMFAQLMADKLQFKGVSAKDYGIAGVQTIDRQQQDAAVQSWEDFYARQQETLVRLAEEFKNGYARVDPKHSQTCRQCDLQLLCRVHERGEI